MVASRAVAWRAGQMDRRLGVQQMCLRDAAETELLVAHASGDLAVLSTADGALQPLAPGLCSTPVTGLGSSFTDG